MLLKESTAATQASEYSLYTEAKKRFRLKLFEKQQGACWWCRNPMQLNAMRLRADGTTKCNQSYATFEHLIPKSLGGSRRGKKNIVLAHASCNNKRHKRRWVHDPVYGRKK